MLWMSFAIAALLAQHTLGQESSDLPRIPLRVGLYVNPEVRDYNTKTPGAVATFVAREPMPVGFWLRSAAADLGTKVFASVQVLVRYPPPPDSKDLQDLDCVLVIETFHGDVSGYATKTIKIDDTFVVYTTAGNRVYGSTEEQTQKVKFPMFSMSTIDANTRKVQEAAKEAIASTVRQFLSKFAKTELATSPRPAVKPAPPSVGTLVLSTEPTGVQVYLDDQFKGVTSEQDGKLVVGNVPAGTYGLRVSQAGHKDWAQSITVNPGEELKVQAKLASAGPNPLTLKEVEDALTNGVPKSRVTALVNQYGVNFVLTNEAEQRLRNAGADSELLLAIAKSRK